MKSSGLRSRLAALVTAGIACVCLLSLSSATAWAKVGSIKEFPIPTSGSSPFGITKGPDGNLWFTEFFGVGKIGRITTAGVVINEFPIPTGLSRPVGITAGPHTTLWFTESGGNKIGKITG